MKQPMQKRAPSLPEFLTVPEAARKTGLDKRCILKAAEDGEIPLYTLGKRWQRVTVSDLNAWIRSRKK